MRIGRLVGFGALAFSFVFAACSTPPREAEPSELFRAALDEVMLRQPPANKVKPDQLENRKEAVVLNLSLDDCIELAMSHNRPILFERLAAEVAAANIVGARAPLDFRIGANVSYTRTTRPVNNSFPGDTRDQDIAAVTNYGINATLPFESGTTVELGGAFVRSDSNSPFQRFEFFPETTLTVRQHLLNGFGFVPNLGASWLAENDKTIADLQVMASRNTQAFTVALAYWDLVQAEEELVLFGEEADLARQARDLAQSRLDSGIGTKLDVLVQQAQVKASEVSIIQAGNSRDQRRDDLLRAIQPDLVTGFALFLNYAVTIKPTTQPDTERQSGDDPVTLEEIKGALRRRPEIQQAVKRIENAGISIKMTEHGLLPTLDLEGHFGVNGSGSDADASFQSYNDFENIEYGFGLSFSVPLQNRAARANRTRADIGRRNAILAARETETTIILEVVAAVRNIKSSRSAVAAAMDGQRLQEETYKAAQERETAGVGTPFEVKQASNDRTEANLNLSRARIALQRSRLGLMKATGELGR